jgi:hypothetical protein
MSAQAMVAAFPIFLKDDRENKLALQYISECLRLSTANTAQNVPNGGYLERPLWDILHPGKVDNRTSDEIVAEIRAKLQNQDYQGQ